MTDTYLKKIADTIVFLSQPMDTIIEINGSAEFQCVYEGSFSFPVWIINSIVYFHFETFPSNHQLDSSGSYLTVVHADLSMDGNSYQCAIDSCFSDTGHLYVFQSVNTTQGIYRSTVMMHHLL